MATAKPETAAALLRAQEREKRGFVDPLSTRAKPDSRLQHDKLAEVVAASVGPVQVQPDLLPLVSPMLVKAAPSSVAATCTTLTVAWSATNASSSSSPSGSDLKRSMPIFKVEHYASSLLSMFASYTPSAGTHDGSDDVALGSKPAPGFKLAWTPSAVDLKAYGLGANVVATTGMHITGLAPGTQYYVRVTPGLLTFKSGEPILRSDGVDSKAPLDSFAVVWGAPTPDSAGMMTVSQAEWDAKVKAEAAAAEAAAKAETEAKAAAKAAAEAEAVKKLAVATLASTAVSHTQEAALLTTLKDASVADRKRMFESRSSISAAAAAPPVGVKRVLVPSSELDSMRKHIDELQAKLGAVAVTERAAAAAELEARQKDLAEAHANNAAASEAEAPAPEAVPATSAPTSGTDAPASGASNAAYTDPGIVGTVFSYVGAFVGMTGGSASATSAPAPAASVAAVACVAPDTPAEKPAE